MRSAGLRPGPGADDGARTLRDDEGLPGPPALLEYATLVVRVALSVSGLG